MSSQQTAARSTHGSRTASPQRKRRRKAGVRRLSRVLAWLLSSLIGAFAATTLVYAQVPNIAAPLPAGALPQGGKVVVGSGQLSLVPNKLLVQQNTAKLGLDWQSFDIGSGASVEFRQPDANSIALNRVLGNDASRIYGSLQANGQVFLTNPNGVLFAPGARVDVGGLVASTLDLSQQDFARGQYEFKPGGGNNKGTVVNEGSLRASHGGYLVLLGQDVANKGDITVDAGRVLLASGSAATVSISGSGLISAVVAANTAAAGSVENSGRIQADGGVVTLNAQSARDIASSLVNNSGIVRANSMVERNGEIWITGDRVASSGSVQADASGGLNAGRVTVKGDMERGRLEFSGSISARSTDASGAGGQVETSAAHVAIDRSARVDTRGASYGTWLIDPTDFTVSAGSAAQTVSGIGADTLSTNLGSSSVTLATATTGTEPGDIHVNAAVAWSAGTTLTLTASRNINVNAGISASGIGASLVLTPGSGGSFNLTGTASITLSGTQQSLQIAGVSYSLIRDLAGLQAIDTNATTRAGNYALAGNIDATASAAMNNGLGFAPIGGVASFTSNDSFRGRFDGLGHTITGLTIARPTEDNVGLFGVTHDATVRNTRLAGGSVTGRNNVGGFIGQAESNATNAVTTLVNLHSSQSVTGSAASSSYVAGGLVGYWNAASGTIDRSTSSTSIGTSTGDGYYGGLVGHAARGLSVSNSSASGNIGNTASANGRFGGLIGFIDGTGSLTNVSASGNVAGGFYAGGLVGHFDSSGTIDGATTTGSVSGGQYAGGLVGYHDQGGVVRNVTTSGAVQGDLDAGGVIGYWTNGAGIVNANSSGTVTAPGSVGGLVGYGSANGAISGSQTSGAITGPQYVGGLAGNLNGTSVASSSSSSVVTGTVNGTNNNTVYVGGLLGYYNANSSTTPYSITGSSATGAVTSAAPFGNIGGLGGYVIVNTLTGSTASGNVQATHPTDSRSVGGLMGYVNVTGTASSVSATGAVSGGSYAGGLFGQYYGASLATANAIGNVSGSSYVGGLIGYAQFSGTVNAATASGSVTATGTAAGGLIGYYTSSGSIIDSRATGNVVGRTYAGGLIGFGSSNGTIVNSSAAGTVSGEIYVGGLGGEINYTNLSRATATGRVQAVADSTVYAGGLVGYYYNYNAGAQVADSSASGSVVVDAQGGYAGGLIGYSAAGNILAGNASGSVSITDSANPANFNHTGGGLVGVFIGDRVSDSGASGAVSARNLAGGLLGSAQSQTASPVGISNVSATGNVTSGRSAGGLIGELFNMGVTNGSASGRVTSTDTQNSNYVGGLIGRVRPFYAGSSIVSSRATGDVTGRYMTGGLVGYWDGSSMNTGATAGIQSSTASGKVSGVTYTGGLVGYYSGVSSPATADLGIRNSAAAGNVDGAQYVGGLVGYFSGYGGVRASMASGNVVGTGNTGINYLGGLAGTYLNANSTAGVGLLEQSYASGNVSLAAGATLGTSSPVWAGGLVGQLQGQSAAAVALADSWASGAVSVSNVRGALVAGGLVGQAQASIARSYSIGAVSATGGTTRAAGGLVGTRQTASVAATNSFWATDTSGQSASVIGSARTLSELQQLSTFSSWTNIDATGGSASVWRMYDGTATPLVRALLSPLTVALADVSRVYDGTASLAGVTIPNTTASNPERILVGGISSPDVGTYALTAGNLYSVQNGYDLTVTGSANFTITARALTLAGLVSDKVYDGGTVATIASGAQPGSLVAGEDLVFVPGSGFTAAFGSKTVGLDKTVTLTGSYGFADGTRGKASNYVLPSGSTTTADITPATLNAGSFAATNRAYNGSTSVDVTAASATLTGVIGNDDVSVNLAGVSTGTMADKNVGSGKAVSVNGVQITGADAGNYVVAGTSTTVSITPRALTVNGITATNRQYNAGLSVGVSSSSATLGGLIGGDVVELRNTSITGTMADRHVGTAKPVTIGGLALRGTDAFNYTPSAGPVTVDITPYLLNLFVQRTTQTDRVYDGTAAATVSIPVQWYSVDNIAVGYTSMAYNDKNVAYTTGGAVTSKTITVAGFSLSGTNAGNYTLQNTSATTTGTISPKPLPVTGIAATNRVYDGTRDVTVDVSNATVDLTAVVPGDSVNVVIPGSGTVTGQANDKNAGTNKPVTVPGLAVTGTDAGNYTVNSATNGVTVTISRKNLTAVYTGLDKVYDGNALAALSVGSPDIVAGDTVRFFADQTYCGLCGYAYFTTGSTNPQNYTQSKNAALDKTIVVVSNGLYGTDSGNYTLLNSTGSAAPADITPKPVTLAFSGVTKVYDGTTDAAVTLNRGASGIVGSDVLTTTQTALYTGTGAKNVGTNKPISVSSIVLGGTDAGNYTVGNTTANTTGSVTAKPITVSGITAVDRAYDATTTVQVDATNVGSSGFVPGDTVSISLPSGGLSTGTIANKNVGLDKPVTVTGLTLAGIDAGNYLIDSTSSGILVDITPKLLTAGYNPLTRVYDGGTAATVVSNTAGVEAGDVVNLTQTALFTGLDGRNAGSNKPVAVSNIAISGGAGSGNYALASTTAATTGTITPKPVTASYAGGTRVYDGVANTAAPVSGSSLQFVAGDNVGFTQTAVFTTDGSAGTGKPVAVSNIGLAGIHAANYSVASGSAATTATVTPRPLGVTGVNATNRVYDGTTTVSVDVANATVDTGSVIAGDQVIVNLPSSGITTGSMLDRHVGIDKPVTITGLALSGSSALNYQLVGATGLTVDISALAISAAYTGVDKIYNGNATAQVLGSSSGIFSIDTGFVGISATGVFTAGKNVGTNKDVAVSGGFLTGALRENYSLANTTGSATASISRKDVTASYASGQSKVYDGTDVAPASGNVVGLVAGDNVGLTQQATFTTGKNVANNKPIAVSNLGLSGTDAGNYRLTTTSFATVGNITPKPITVSGLSSVVAQDRIYDGTTLVQVTVPSGVTLVPNSNDIVPGDSVTIDVPSSGITSGNTADKRVGNAKPVQVDGLTLSGTDAINYRIGGTAGITVNISPKQLTAAFTGVDRVYDGSVGATVTGSSAGVIAGDSLTITGTGLFTGAGAKDVGLDKAIDVLTARLNGSDAGNYLLLNTTGSASADITPKTVSTSWLGGTRVYDGTTAAPVTGASNGFVFGDNVGLDQTATFTGAGGRNVGQDKAISITGISLVGTDAANYQLGSTSASATGAITPKGVRIDGLSGVSAQGREYDGSTQVAVQLSTTGALSVNPLDVIVGDTLGVSAPSGGLTTGTMLDKNAGLNKAVQVDGLSLTGSSAGNYVITATTGVVVDVSQRLLLNTSWAGVSRVYDGTVAASLTGSASNIVFGDSLSLVGSGIFTGTGARNVGTGKAITVQSGSLSGADAGNYRLGTFSGSSATGDITPRALTASWVGGTRVYDGLVSAPVVGSLANLVAGDQVSLLQTAEFSGSGAKNVGANKPVSIGGVSLAGTDAGNYTVGGNTSGITASVTQRSLRLDGLTGIAATDRVYDSTSTVAVVVSSTGTITPNPQDLVPGDIVSVVAPASGVTTGMMLDRYAGSNKPVDVQGLGLSGADAGNYSVTQTSGVTVNISRRPITASYSGVQREYNGTTTVSLEGTLNGVYSIDSVTVAGTGIYTDGKNAGTGKPINVLNATLSDVDAGNYLLANPNGSATGNVTPKTVTIAWTGGTRVYDGLTSAPVSGVANGFLVGDVVGFTQTAVFTGPGAKNAGSDKPVEISGISLNGLDALNYRLPGFTAITTAAATARPLRIDGLTGATAQNREYDGSNLVAVQFTTSGPVTPNSQDLIPGDVVTVNLPGSGTTNGTAAQSNVGTSIGVSLTGISLGGLDGGNYVASTVGGVTVDITPRLLTSTWSTASRVYDGTTAALIAGSLDRVVSGESISVSGSGSFADKNAGLGKTVTIAGGVLSAGTGTGSLASNYLLVNPNGTTTGDITPKAITASYTAADKVYDQLTAASVTGTLTGLIAGDTVSLSQNASFGDKNVGTAKLVTIGGLALGGIDASNYSVSAGAGLVRASITPRSLSITGLAGITATDRVYDGGLGVSLSYNGAAGNAAGNFLPGDDVTIALPSGGINAGVMLDKNAGQGKAVVVAGLQLGGTDGGNYVVTGTAGVTVNIAPKAIGSTTWTGTNKVYDATTGATVAGSSTDVIAGDALSIVGSGSFADKNVGSGKAIVVSGATLRGADAGNYTLGSASGSATADITALTISAAYTGFSKVYDGTATALVNGSLLGLLGTDVVTLSQSSEFTSAGGGKNVGTGKELRVFDIALGGTDGANYRLAGSTLLTTGSVTPRALNVTGLSGISAVSRVYDGTRNVAIVVAGNAGVGGGNFVPGDDVSIALPSGGISAGTMADKNVGNDKAVVISGLQLNGTDAGNYVVTGTAGVTVNITPLAVTLDGVRAVNRSYDGTTAVAIDTSGGRVLGTIAGDDVALRTSGVAGALADKSAGDGRAVSVSGLALIGTDAGNYSASGGTGLTVNIARRVLNIGFVASNKVFDGSSAASFGGLTNNALAGDLIVLSGGSASFNDANAGNGKTVTLGGLIVGGADAGNYSAANPTFTGSANITPRPLTVAGTSIVRYADDITPLVPGFSTNVGGLVGTDRIASVSFGALPNLANALGGSLYELVPSNAVFGTGTAGNYSVSYVNGLLVVLPKPPRLGEVETGGNTGGQGLALLLSPQELAAGLAALERAAEFAANNTQGGNPLASAAGGADVRRLPSIDPADLAALLSGDGQRITLPTLQRLPLISFDPELMRKLQGAVQRVAP